MTFRHFAFVLAALVCLPVSACVVPARTEDAALIGARPTGLARPIDGPARAGAPFPSLGGDILAGTSPGILAKARAAQAEALTQALAKP